MMLDWGSAIIVVNIIQALSGLGLILFSLRFLTESLDESLDIYLGLKMKHFLKKGPWSLLWGFGATALFQASSITIITSMGLLARGLISLRTGIFLAIGASVGTTCKAFLFLTLTSFKEFNYIWTLGPGPLLIVIPTMLHFLLKSPFAKRLLDLILSVGLLFLGWQILGLGLEPFIHHEGVTQYLTHLKGTGFLSILMCFLAGFVLTVSVQSSSTVIFLVLGLGAANKLSFITGMGIILGANVGTTLTGLFISLDYKRSVKRLALSHFLIKFMGVMLVFITLDTYVFCFELLVGWAIGTQSLVSKLACFHFFFNLTNATVWTFGINLLERITFLLIKKDDKPLNLWPIGNVKNMLSQNPKQGLMEIKEEWNNLQLRIKAFEDRVIEKFLGESNPHDHHPLHAVKTDELKEKLKASQDLLTSIMLRHKDYFHQASFHLQSFTHLKLAFEETLLLKKVFDSLPKKKRSHISDIFFPFFVEFDRLRNEIWSELFMASQLKNNLGPTSGQELNFFSLSHFVSTTLEDNMQDIIEQGDKLKNDDIKLIYQITHSFINLIEKLLILINTHKEHRPLRESSPPKQDLFLKAKARPKLPEDNLFTP